MDVRERLKEGIRRFRTEVYPERREAYTKAEAEPQKPHTLIVACADSRIDPGMITQSDPGDLFVTRNIGNMVPTYGEMMGGVSAVLEYAVSALKVQHVVICGHTDCGAMKALMNPGQLERMPTVRRWLRNAEAALSVARELDGGDDFLMNLTKQNVLMQMTHARTHPSIAGAVARDELVISGWVYEIGSGNVLIYDEVRQTFEPVVTE
ncbi:MAG TPA: carbonic anhydrase [Terracidiphilus sp.]